jgi:HYR domain
LKYYSSLFFNRHHHVFNRQLLPIDRLWVNNVFMPNIFTLLKFYTMHHFTFLITKFKSIALLICYFCIYLQGNAQFLSIPFGSNIGIGCNFTGIKNNSYIRPDNTYSALASCDDCYQYIPLPFLFNCKGKKYNHIYINNNGSISMTAGISTYVSSLFPIASLPYPIIAPFMADVDTRDYPATKGVKYKISPHRIIVTWDSVASYDVVWFGPSFSNPAPRNSFQIILSDGTDTLVGIGKNVAIRYGKMQWTFGVASANQHASYGYQLGDNVNDCNFTGSMTQVQMSYHLDSMSVTGSLITVLNIAKDSCPTGIATNGGLHASVANSAISSYTYNLSSSVIGFTPVTNTTGIFTSLPKAFYTIKATNAFLDTLTKVFNLGSNTVYYDTACFTFTTSWGDAVYSSGTYNHTYSSILSCDSVVTHHVFINYSCPSNITQNTDAGQCSAIVNYNPPVASCNNVTPILLFGGASGSTFPKGVNAVIYGTPYNTATYNFNALTSGISINAQDGWLGSSAGFSNNSTTQVSNATPFANPQSSGLGLLANAVGANKTSFATRVDNANFSIPNFDANGMMTIQFDARQTYWGNALQFGFDANANGYLSGANEISFGVRYSVVNNNISLIGAGGVVLASISSSSYMIDPRWRQFKLTIDKNANAGAGSISLSFRDVVNNGPWILAAALQNKNAGFNPLATDATNLMNLNAMVYEHNAGISPSENSFLDNIIFTRYNVCSFNINVVDNELPVITCPANIIANAPSGFCNATVNYATPTVTDNCPNTSISLIAGLPSGSSFPVGVTTNVYKVTDASGNFNTCSFTVLVNDNQAPTIICPNNIVTNVAPGTCAANVIYSLPIGSDNCGSATILKISGLASGSSFPKGTTSNVYQVTDVNGNSNTCSFSVTVNDNQAPTIACNTFAITNALNSFGNIEATSPSGAIVNFTLPSALDNCPTVIVSSSAASGSQFPKGVNTLTITATDASNNSSTCTASFLVQDKTPPLFTNCPSNITVNLVAGCQALVSWIPPTVTDVANPNPFVSSNFLSGTNFSLGNTTVTYTAVDANGNSSSCSFVITVVDTIAPTINCPANIAVNTQVGLCSAVVTYTAPIGIDNCLTTTTTQIAGLPSGAAFPKGVTTNTFKVIDGSGNINTCSFTVTVSDNQAPTIVCPANIFVNTDLNLCTAIVNYVTPIGIDNCSGATVTQIAGLPSGAAFPKGFTLNTFKVTDGAGNNSTCVFSVLVTDTQAPTIACNTFAITNPLNSLGQIEANSPWGAIVNFTLPTAIDNCTPTLVMAQPTSGSFLPIGIHTITIFAQDQNGNQSSCTKSIEVADKTPPLITNCPLNIIVNVVAGCQALVNWLPPTVTDVADPNPFISSNFLSGTNFPLGNTTVTYTAVDANGNSSSCSFVITVVDTIAPTINCPANIAVNTQVGLCSAVVTYTAPIGIDNCLTTTTTQIAGLPSGAAFPKGVTTNTFKAIDGSGNINTCSFTVTVSDNQAPTIICPANIMKNNDANVCGAITNYTISTNDNCPGETITQSAGLPSGSVFPKGITTNSFIATDANGNTTTCSFTVTIIDNQLPIITCPANINTMANYANCIYNGAIGIATATDNCLGTSITNNAPVNIPEGVNIYTYTATDASGNTASCLQTITINKAPVLVVAHSATTLFTNDVVHLEITSPIGGSNYGWVGAGGLASATDNLIEKVASANTGIYTASVIDAFGCNISTTISITVNASIVVNVKALLSGPYITSAGIMQDSLRVKNMIPTKEPYGSLPYSPIFAHATNSNIGIDCTDPILLSNASLVTGGDAIVDWVFLQVRQAADPSIVLASRSALLQRDGDVVREDGISPVTFQGLPPDNYFISIKHRTHLGLMSDAYMALSETPTLIDYTNASASYFSRASPNNNASPLTGASRIMGGKRAMYTGNCNIGTNAWSRFITYNNTINSDRTSMIGTVGNTGTITGYSIFDIDMNGYARFNGLHPDRIVLLLNCVNNSSIYVQEQTPN